MAVENGAEGEKQIDVKPATESQAKEQPKGAEAPPQSSGGKVDAFADAFKSAQRDLGELDDEEDKPARKPAKAKKDDEDKPAKPAKKDEKQTPAQDKKPDVDAKAKAKDDAGDDDEDDGEEKPAPKPKAPLKPRASWSAKRQEDFMYLDEATKARWLAEPARAPDHWTPEEKAALEAITDEGLKDHYIASRKSFEKGYQAKFEALAGERKTFDEIKAAVPPGLRQEMQRRGIGEAQMFRTLVGLQAKSMEDPIGYVADFIGRNKVDLQQLADRLDGQPAQPAQRQAADVRNHPEFRAMAERLSELEGHVNGQIQQRNQTIQQESGQALQKLLTSTAEGGELRYPLARVLSHDMADLLEGDPDTFEGMSYEERFDLAYRTALDNRPELAALKKEAKPPVRAEEREDDGEDDEEEDDERAKRLKAAKSRKSKAMTPSKGAGGGDPFSAAYNSAKAESGYA